MFQTLWSVLTRRVHFIFISGALTGTYHWYQSSVTMATNKERIEALEAGLGGVQDGMQRLEDTVNRLSEILLSTRESSNNHNNGREGFVQPHQNDGGRQIFSSKMAKLEFPKYSGDDPTEWFNRVAQFFEFQEIGRAHV